MESFYLVKYDAAFDDRIKSIDRGSLVYDDSSIKKKELAFKARRCKRDYNDLDTRL
jgi:hypothetical protein